MFFIPRSPLQLALTICAWEVTCCIDTEIHGSLFPELSLLGQFLWFCFSDQPSPPVEEHKTYDMQNGTILSPFSTMDRIRQHAVLNHVPHSPHLLRLRDISGAIVTDVIDSSNRVNGDQMSRFFHHGRLIEAIDSTRIVQLAGTACSLRFAQSTVRSGDAIS